MPINAPDYIQFYPTMRCNRSCEFCFNRSMPDVPDMEGDRLRTLLDKLSALGVMTIDIMGGEPTMHEDMVPFIRDAVSRGLRVNISSNGTDIARLGEISAIDGPVTLGVSINDRETLVSLRPFIHEHKPVAKTVFSPGLDPELVSELHSLPVRKFYLIYRDAMASDDLAGTVSFPRYLEEVRRLSSAAETGTVYCSGFLPERSAHPELAAVRCPAGTTKLGILPDGGAYPCNLFFGRKEFLLGNMLTDPFEMIWRNPALAFFRAFSGNPCPDITCPLHAGCHGGCPAHSLIHGGSLHAPEPRCTLAGRGPHSLI